MISAKAVIAFALGAAVGVASCAIYFKNKYQEMYNQDVQAIRDYYNKLNAQNESSKDSSSDEKPAETKKDDSLTSYARTVADYTKYNTDNTKPIFVERQEDVVTEVEPSKSGIEVEKSNFAPMSNPHPPKPYRIDADEFGQNEDFDPIYWEFYTDGVLVNENYEPIENIMDWIGDGLRVFADTEDNIFWIRNEKYGVDIEVARSAMSWEKERKFHGYVDDVVGD